MDRRPHLLLKTTVGKAQVQQPSFGMLAKKLAAAQRVAVRASGAIVNDSNK
jgi:hypothetical protein